MSAETAAAVSELFKDAPATPDASSETPAGAPATPATPAPATPAQQEAYFLEINDRTRYKTVDEAKKGWSELSALAERLRPWEQLTKPVSEGGFGLTPDQAVKHLDTYATELFQRQNAAPATPGSRSDSATVGAAARGDQSAYESLTPEWKAHIDEMKRNGFLTKEDIKPLQDKVAAFDAQAAQQQVELQNAAVDHCETLLQGLLKENNVAVSDEEFKEIGEAIGGKLERASYDAHGKLIPGSPIDKIFRGDEATRKEIVKQYAQVFLKFGDTYAKSRTAAAAADKTAAMNSQSRTLPAAGTPTPATPDRSRTPQEQKDRERVLKVRSMVGEG